MRPATTKTLSSSLSQSRTLEAMRMASSRRATRRSRVICLWREEGGVAAATPENDKAKLALRRVLLLSATSEDEMAVAVAAVGLVWSHIFMVNKNTKWFECAQRNDELHCCALCRTGTDLKMTPHLLCSASVTCRLTVTLDQFLLNSYVLSHSEEANLPMNGMKTASPSVKRHDVLRPIEVLELLRWHIANQARCRARYR
jgi:hypothetical protein